MAVRAPSPLRAGALAGRVEPQSTHGGSNDFRPCRPPGPPGPGRWRPGQSTDSKTNGDEMTQNEMTNEMNSGMTNGPKPFRSITHGTCLLNGKHLAGSPEARACPVLQRQGRALRRLERLQAAGTVPVQPPAISPQGACLEPSSSPEISETSNTIFRRGRAFGSSVQARPSAGPAVGAAAGRVSVTARTVRARPEWSLEPDYSVSIVRLR